jgi:DNA gyrase inhibitor GyrI
MEDVVPGGAYARIRLEGEPPAIYDDIPQSIEILEGSFDVDPKRPYIEYYRRRDMIDVIVPVQ